MTGAQPDPLWAEMEKPAIIKMEGNITPEMAERFAACLKAAWERDRGKPPRLLTHLWLARQVNGAGIWLVEHGHVTAAETSRDFSAA